jgi:hypothetical protein
MRMTVWTLVLLGLGALIQEQNRCPGAQPGTRPAERPREEKKPVHDPLPATRKWDLKELQALGTIISTQHDKTNNRLIWVIETEQFVKPGRIAPLFYDDEGSPLATGYDLEFMPLKKERGEMKERVQVSLQLPGKEVLRETFRVVLHKF